MSVRAINDAYRVKAGSPSSKMVLLALANHAGEDSKCWPSISKLETETELHANTVRRSLRDLERRGLISREERYSPGTRCRISDLYTLHLSLRHATTSSHHGTTSSHHATTKVLPPCNEGTPTMGGTSKPSIEPSESAPQKRKR